MTTVSPQGVFWLNDYVATPATQGDLYRLDLRFDRDRDTSPMILTYVKVPSRLVKVREGEEMVEKDAEIVETRVSGLDIETTVGNSDRPFWKVVWMMDAPLEIVAGSPTDDFVE
jgi:hypothetical protein